MKIKAAFTPYATDYNTCSFTLYATDYNTCAHSCPLNILGIPRKQTREMEAEERWGEAYSLATETAKLRYLSRVRAKSCDLADGERSKNDGGDSLQHRARSAFNAFSPKH